MAGFKYWTEQPNIKIRLNLGDAHPFLRVYKNEYLEAHKPD